MATFEHTDEKLLLSLEVLQEQMAIGSRLSPLRGFTFNFGNALSALGLIMTWAIVLLQFRLTAPPGNDSNSANSTNSTA